MEMNEFIRMFLRMFIQVGPYLVVFVVLGYIINRRFSISGCII